MLTNSKIPAGYLTHSIEDAIFFGHVDELDAVLEKVADDDDFPDELRYGLEALRHFRAYYGKDGALEPQGWLQKQKIAVMESAWGSHLLDWLRHNEILMQKHA